MPPDLTRDVELWTLRKGAQRVSATMRAIDQVGTELRFLMGGELYMGQLFKPGQGAALEATANAKRAELKGKGWVEQETRSAE